MTTTLSRLPLPGERPCRPVCPTCGRRHWELMSTEAAARHAHMSPERFRAAVKAGQGPQQWAHDLYRHPRFHVAEVDRWLAATGVAA